MTKRRWLNANDGTAMHTEELAIGVEDMEVTYGVDMDADGAIDRFVSANAMDLDANGTIDSDDWKRALTVKVELVFRSQNPASPKVETRTYAGTDYSDRYMRQLFQSTIRIRNRG